MKVGDKDAASGSNNAINNTTTIHVSVMHEVLRIFIFVSLRQVVGLDVFR